MCLEPHAQPARRLVSRQGSWAPRAFTGFRSPHGRLFAESPRQSLASRQLWPHLEEVWQSPGPPAPQPPASELQLISASRRLGLQEPAGPRLTALSPGVGEAGRGMGRWARASSSRNHITGGPKQRPQRRQGLAHPRCKRLFFCTRFPTPLSSGWLSSPSGVRLRGLKGVCTPVIAPSSPRILAIPLHRLTDADGCVWVCLGSQTKRSETLPHLAWGFPVQPGRPWVSCLHGNLTVD